ncbi:RND family efflux transporter MFP subunit [Parabacteroides sp. PFB2-10]|uniref:efflux RND transporter periplasmic adaptor subunit n=1 Tax=Parabacteroides sp. PFB2-10 TaxID=1742405 RepID=UPI002474AD15|nr:efflux RND transporter periplasmic adaptor subunit [Parabacteroides sp. PFB2-10]MDH6313513.1 RND family efflux transporter MFP subunit [Parabacteroides sp. PFB2-10]
MKTSKVLSVIPVAAVVLLMSCSGNKVQEQTVEEKVKVKLETVHMQEVDQIAEFTASVEANISNMIAPQAPARIGKLHVEVGDRVRAGQLLATMDETQLRQTQIQLENLETEFKRIDELYKVGGVSQSAWEGQKMALDLQKTALKNLEENNKLVSPISGIVTARNYDNGDMYSGAQPVYTVEQINPVKLIVNVSESYFTLVSKGKEVDVRLDVYGDEVFKGQVNLVYPTIDPLTRTFQVEIKLNNNDQRVRPGMFARVVMHFGAKEHVVIPDQAVVKQAGSGDRYVYIYKNGKVSYDKIELGRRMDNRYEVISGVKDGDQVVTTGQNRLTNGMEVDIVK